MNILQIVPSYKPAYIYGGPIVSVAELCEKLAAAGHQVQVFTTTANGKGELAMVPGTSLVIEQVNITYFRRITRDHTHFSPALLARLWKSAAEWDIVHIHAWWNTVSVLSCLIALLKGRKVVISPRGTLSNYSFTNRNNFYKNVIHKSIGIKLLKKCTLHATSENERSQLAHLIGPARITVIPNLVKMNLSRVPANGIPGNGQFRLLFFSRIEEKKGLDLLLKSLAGVEVPFRLTVSGGGEAGYVSEMKELAATLGIAQKITWTGTVGQEHKFSVMGSHDLLILPSYDENFGNVVIESLSAGTPVLISNGVGLSYYVQQAGLGWVCGPDEREIADGIHAAWLDTEKRRMIRIHAPGRVSADFNEDRLILQYLELYKRVTDE